MGRWRVVGIAALLAAGCADPDLARHALGRQGYREVAVQPARFEGSALRCDTTRAFGFTALDAAGRPRRGNVCCPVIGACRIVDERDAARETQEINRRTREWIEGLDAD